VALQVEQTDQQLAPRRRIRRIWIAAAVAGALLVAVLVVSWVANRDTWAGKGQPVVAPTLAGTPAPAWKPPADPLGRIRYELESRVLNSARVARPTSSGCDRSEFTGDQPATFSCTVSYDKLKVVYTVSARPNGKSFQYTATAPKTVVTRQGLLALVWQHYGLPAKLRMADLRCDEFPETALVAVRRTLDQVCYGKLPGQRLTSKITIAPSDTAEPYLEVVKQK
jgi:hypothetical protein